MVRRRPAGRCTRTSTSRSKPGSAESEAWRYEREHSRQVLQQRLRAAQLAGHDIGAIIDQITAAPMDRARSISSVLHGRLQQLKLPDLGHDVTWAQRTPKDAPAVAHELAAGLDDRARALGEQLAASPEPWLARQLGVLAPHASPRCARTTPGGPGPPRPTGKPPGSPTPARPSHPNRTAATPNSTTCARPRSAPWKYATKPKSSRRMTHGELEARILDGDRALASAPPDVSRELRLTAQAEADAWQQSADAETRHDQAGSADATGARPPHGRPARAARSRQRPLREMGHRHQHAGGKQPGKPRPSWSGADSRSRQPDSGSPRPKGNRRPWWSGGASSKPTSPP